MFDILSKIDRQMTHENVVSTELNTATMQITRMYNVALLLCWKAAIIDQEPFDKVHAILQRLYVVLLPEYTEYVISLASLQLKKKRDIVPDDVKDDIVKLYDKLLSWDATVLPRYLHQLCLHNDVTRLCKLSGMYEFMSPVNMLCEDHEEVIRRALDSPVSFYKFAQSMEQFLDVHLVHFFKMYWEANTVPFMQKFNAALLKEAPFLQWRAPFLDRPRRPGKLRIGYVSYYMHTAHSVFCVFQGNILQAPPDVEVFTFFMDTPIMYAPSEFAKKCPNPIFIHRPQNRTEPDPFILREEIAKYELDVLVYPEIGEHSLTYYCACSRLARVQVASIGHCDTSGVPTIDYYISSTLYEPLDAQKYYTEKLVLLNGLVSYYVPPFSHHHGDHALVTICDAFKTREELGLPTQGTLFACIQTEFKFNVRFLRVLRKILDATPSSFVLIKEPHYPCYKHNSKQRIVSFLGDRVVFLPWMQQHLYHNVLHHCDIVLTPFPFGGFCTTLDAFYYDKPVVTLEGKKLMGRFTSGFYQHMGMNDMISRTEEEYVQQAIRLTFDQSWYQDVKMRIRNKKSRLFCHAQSAQEWYDTLQKLNVYIQ